MAMMMTSRLKSVRRWMGSNAMTARHASTQATSMPSNASNASETTNPKSNSMTWTQFFECRRARRRWELLGGLLGGFGGFSGGGYYFFCVADFDPTQPLLGLPDPTIAYVGGALAVGGLSLGLGLMGAGALWRLSTQRSILEALDKKEKDFFTRLSRYRPRFRSLPVSGEVTLPDYYGEKVNSIAAYRKWIRKQRDFNARNANV